MDALKARLIIGAIRVLATCSLPMAQRLGRALGGILWKTGSDTARITRINLALCFPEMDATEREELAQESVRQTACTMMETGIAWLWPQERSAALVRRTVNAELLDRCMADSRGLVVVMPHLANWEMINQQFTARYHGHAIYKPPGLKQLDQFIIRQRRQFGHGFDLYPNTRDGVESLYEAVRQGGCAFVLPDQEPSLKSGVWASFFGVPALTSQLVPRMQAETGCAVICGYVIRLPDAAGFEVHYREMEPGYDDPDVVTAAAAINRTVEQVVMEAPAQYQWEYKRFKRRPEGLPKVYDRRRPAVPEAQ